MEIGWLQLGTLAIALLGAVLGVLNTWRAFSNDRVRLRVRGAYIMRTDGVEGMSVEVVNLSVFPVTITAMGATMRDGRGKHWQFLGLFFPGGEALPHRLEPRTALTALLIPSAPELDVMQASEALYVSTACGLFVTGGQRELRAAVHNLSLARD